MGVAVGGPGYGSQSRIPFTEIGLACREMVGSECFQVINWATGDATTDGTLGMEIGDLPEPKGGWSCLVG